MKLNMNIELLAFITTPIITGMVGYGLGLSRDKYKRIFEQKNTTYAKYLRHIMQFNLEGDPQKIRKENIEYAVPARLLAGERLHNEIREYYSRLSEYLERSPHNNKDELSAVTESAMRIEQEMRVEIIGKKELSNELIKDLTRK